MRFKLACADFAFPLLGHQKSLELIATLGFEGADIGLFENRSHLWPSSELKNVGRSARLLARKTGDLGLKIADVFLQMELDFVTYAINHPSAARRRKARDWFHKTLEYANLCGCTHVTTLPGAIFKGERRAAVWGRCTEELTWRCERAKDAKIVFATEAHIGSIAQTPRQVQRLLDDVHGLTLTLDYTHFTRMGRPDKEIEPLLKHASHFHVRGASKGRLQTSFKENTINYKRICDVFEKVGYRGYLGIEYTWNEWEQCNRTDNLSETILFRDFLRDLK